jgi:hypothetical protein
MTLLDLNAKVERIFKNPNINFFIIMNLVLMISCFSFINDSTKLAISKFFTNPLITIASLILIIIVGYFNLNIAIMSVALLFIIIYSSYNNSTNNSSNNLYTNINNTNDTDTQIEGFENSERIIANSLEERNRIIKEKRNEINSKLEKQKKQAKKKYQDSNFSDIEKKIDSFKDIITTNLHSVSKEAENEFKEGLLENKHKILENEKTNRKPSSDTNDKHKKNTNNKIKKESFQTIEKRKFDPSSEEDTNLLITKEILKDMINRVEYNYETTPYLKKYIKHRIEEVIDINNLLKDDDE